MAERRAGELLKETPKAKGGQPYQSTGNTVQPVEISTLEEIGITKNQSQAVTSLPTLKDTDIVKGSNQMSNGTTSEKNTHINQSRSLRP